MGFVLRVRLDTLHEPVNRTVRVGAWSSKRPGLAFGGADTPALALG